MQMDQISRGLSQVQENDCRAALTKFMDRNDLLDWGSTVKVEETNAGRYRVKIELTPPTSAGLPAWSVDEIAIADASVDVAAEVDKLLESGYQARVPHAKVEQSQ
jgi:uncharacterized protein involved in high-affinity Fe2+ transport